MVSKRFEAGKIVDRQEVIDKRQCRLHTSRERLVVLGSKQRVQPDQAMAASLKPAEFLAHEIGLTTVPPVGDEQHDGPVAQTPVGPNER